MLTVVAVTEHQNYIGEVANLGWGCVSIIKEDDGSQEYTVLIRTALVGRVGEAVTRSTEL